MAWTVELLPAAAKELRKLDRAAAARIVHTLENRIATLDDPRSLGSALVGEHAGYWRWRIGDYRGSRFWTSASRFGARFIGKFDQFQRIMPEKESK